MLFQRERQMKRGIRGRFRQGIAHGLVEAILVLDTQVEVAHLALI